MHHPPSADDAGLQDGVDVAHGLVLVESALQGLTASEEDLKEAGEGECGSGGGRGRRASTYSELEKPVEREGLCKED